MNKKTILPGLALLIGPALFAQQNLPLIRAKSDQVDIRDGDQFTKGAWTISPQLKPDVYTSPLRNGRVTFYTDLDSISVEIKPDELFQFIILLNDKDSALTQVRSEHFYLETLKKAGLYDFSDQREIPKFTYQSKNDPNLVALREGLKLDSVAGGGSDVSRILNLLHWVHDLIPHDGNHENPTVKNAMSMIAECKKSNRGLNCRGLATVLNECYLALGIPSRFVTCMPKDSVFDDCHVINMVYSRDLQKWLWIDPTNDAYVMNEHGELLGIEEVRARIVNGQALILNPDANWNHRATTEKEYYLGYYMAKNLYRMECPVASEYDTETWKPGKKVAYVELLPLAAGRQTPQKSERTNKRSGVTFVNYKTNNPGLFWGKPE